jgi:ethanolamine utilization protein EutA
MNIRGLREMNVQFPAQTVRATVIGAGAHTLSLSGSTIWLEGVALPLRNSPVAIPVDEADLVAAWQQALMQLDLTRKRTPTCWRCPLHCRCATPRC